MSPTREGVWSNKYSIVCTITHVPIPHPPLLFFQQLSTMPTGSRSKLVQNNSGNTTRPWTGQSASISRPRTAQSRPGTSQATTAATSRYEASFIIALLEGRGIAREVGIAALDRDTGRVMLIQVSCMCNVHLVAHALTIKTHCSLLTARHT